MKQSARTAKLLSFCITAVVTAVVLAPGAAQAAFAITPTYGAYVVAYVGPTGGVDPQAFQAGVLPTPAYGGSPGVLYASGSGGGVTASADLVTGDLTIVADSTPGASTEATALLFTKLTFHGSGQGVISFGGTLSETGSAHAEEWVGLSSFLPFLPEAGFSIVNTGTWSGSSNFSYVDGQSLWAIAQLSGGSQNGGSFSVTDPMHISVLDGTSFTADAPLFLTGGAVPEPGAWIMMLAGIGGLGLMMRWRGKGAAATAA